MLLKTFFMITTLYIVRLAAAESKHAQEVETKRAAAAAVAALAKLERVKRAPAPELAPVVSGGGDGGRDGGGGVGVGVGGGGSPGALGGTAVAAGPALLEPEPEAVPGSPLKATCTPTHKRAIH